MVRHPCLLATVWSRAAFITEKTTSCLRGSSSQGKLMTQHNEFQLCKVRRLEFSFPFLRLHRQTKHFSLNVGNIQVEDSRKYLISLKLCG